MTNIQLLESAIESEKRFNEWLVSQFDTIQTAINALSAKIDIAISKQTTEPLPDTMKIPAAAKYLSIAEITLRNYLRDGLIPFSQLTKGGTVTIQRADLDTYLSATRKKSKAEIEQIANELLGRSN